MGRSRRPAVAKLVMVAWICSGGLTVPATGEAHAVTDDHGVGPGPVAEGDGSGAVSALATPTMSAPVVTGQCPSQLSCGYQCVAQLSSSLCMRLIKWNGGIHVGGVQLGPDVRLRCHVCDCWYIQPGPNGRVFKRTTDFGCSATVGGLSLQ